MRRGEFEVTDPRELSAVLGAVEWGTLALVTPRGTPLQVPLNFVERSGQLHFHGSLAGEKRATLKQNCKASFLLVEDPADRIRTALERRQGPQDARTARAMDSYRPSGA